MGKKNNCEECDEEDFFKRKLFICFLWEVLS